MVPLDGFLQEVIDCRCGGIEWCCNYVSAVLLNEGRPTIITPTMRGTLRAAVHRAGDAGPDDLPPVLRPHQAVDRRGDNVTLETLLALVPGHPPTDVCPDAECMICAVRDCPAQEPLHYHHDGCPVCDRSLSKP
jgi:hypothetical protein